RAGPAGLEMVHPEHRVIGANEPEPAATLTPIYPSTEGLHQAALRRLIEQLLARLEREPLADYLWDQVAPGSPTTPDAVRYLHRPPRDANAALLTSGKHPSQRRIALEELIAQRLGLRRTAAAQRTERAYELAAPEAELQRFRTSLPFALTRAQES